MFCKERNKDRVEFVEIQETGQGLFFCSESDCLFRFEDLMFGGGMKDVTLV